MSDRQILRLAFTISTYTLMHLVYSPTFCITIVSNLSWVLQSFQGKSNTVVMHFFFVARGGGGGNKMHYVKMLN